MSAKICGVKLFSVSNRILRWLCNDINIAKFSNYRIVITLVLVLLCAKQYLSYLFIYFIYLNLKLVQFTYLKTNKNQELLYVISRY